MFARTRSHYQITDKFGEGGMDVVYKAHDTHLDRSAAIKALPPEKVSDPDRKRRFIQEAKAVSPLNRPSIMAICDIDQADGVDYIAMECVAGKTLDKAESRGLVHMTYFTWRWLPVYRHALRPVQEGFLGRWSRFEARYLAGFARVPGYSWRDDPKQSIGVLGEMGSHMIDLARLFVGEIERVSAHLSTFVRKLDPAGNPMDAASDSAVLLLEFASGARRHKPKSVLACMTFPFAGRKGETRIRSRSGSGLPIICRSLVSRVCT